MALPKGRTNNPHGKPKGAVSGKRTSAEIRERIQEFVRNNWSNLEEKMKELSAADYCKTMVNILPYATARFQPVNESDGSDAQNVIQMPTILIQVPDQEKAKALNEANPTMLLDSVE